MEIILKTCNIIEIPPKPSKKEVKIIFIDIFLICILEIKLIPFVISKKPVNSPQINDWSIFKKLKRGENIKIAIFCIPLLFKIDIILEKITTNPPIIKIVDGEACRILKPVKYTIYNIVDEKVMK